MKLNTKTLGLLAIMFIISVATIYAEGFKDITPKEAYEMIKKNASNPNFALIDVRTPEEYKEGYIEGAKNINFLAPAFKEEVNKLDKKKIYILYCRSGGRSKNAQNMMKELGFKEVHNVLGGILRWNEEGLPIKK